MLKRSEAKAQQKQEGANAPVTPRDPGTVTRSSEAPKDVKVEESQRSFSDADDGDGVEVTVTWGTDKYQPVQFNVFEHGPFFVKVKCRKGESVVDAGSRAWAVAQSLAKATYPAKAQEYLANLKKLGHSIKD